MYCANCNQPLPTHDAECPNCNDNSQFTINSEQGDTPYPQQGQPSSNTSHEVPRCTVCGYTGEWLKERMFHPFPLVLAGIILAVLLISTIGNTIGFYELGNISITFQVVGGIYAFLFVPYCLGRIVKRKARICAKCGSVEKFTFLY